MEKCKSVEEWFRTIERGSLPSIQRFRKEIDDIDLRGSYILNNLKHNNVTGLILGSHLGYKDIVRWFLNNKADANAETDLGWRAIHFAAKRGHVATIDLLCANGADVDPVTSVCWFSLSNLRLKKNETPLGLALQSHMRETVRKLINLGAQPSNFSEGLIFHYIHRGILPPELLRRTRLTDADSPGARTKPQTQNHIVPPFRAASPMGIPVTSEHYPTQMESPYDVAVANSNVLVNQLQCQSTSYDLELARRKRELICRLPSLPGLPQNTAHAIIQQTQRLARADLPIGQRLDALSQVIDALPLKNALSDVHDEDARCFGWSAGSSSEPYLRLFEACMCESHCPSALAIRLSQISMVIAAFGSGKCYEINGSALAEDDPRTASVAAYVFRLVRKLIAKSNPQYRAGILAHLSRMLCNPASSHDWNPFFEQLASRQCPDFSTVGGHILSSLVRLGESLDQPVNVARLAHFIGLIGRRLVKSSELSDVLDSCFTRFSDLADILVGWGVDPSSITRGIDLRAILYELRSNLSCWWLDPPLWSLQTHLLKSEKWSPVLLKSMREMMYHLLEDSEIAMRTAVAECPTVSSSRAAIVSGSGSKSPDPTGFLISVRLFLSVLSSIVTGVSSQLSGHRAVSIHQILQLSIEDLTEWIERLLRLAKSAHACLRSSWPSGQALLWHSPHLTNVNVLRVSPSLIDNIEHAIYDLLYCFMRHADFSSRNVQLVARFLNSRLIEFSSLRMSSATLSSLLRFLRQLMKLNDSSTAVESLHAYFGSNSLLHSYKAAFLVCQGQEPPSRLIFSAMCDLAVNDSLREGVIQLALMDLKIALQFLKTDATRKISQSSTLSNCELLGLYSLTLFSTVIKSLTPEERLSWKCRLVVVLEHDCFSVWSCVPLRLRISLLAVLTESSFASSLSSTNLLDLTTAVSDACSLSPLECILIVNLIETCLTSLQKNEHRTELLHRLCVLAHKALLSQCLLQTDSVNVFVKCVGILMSHAFDDTFHSRNLSSASHLARLAQLAASHSCSIVNRAGTDLLLALETCARTSLQSIPHSLLTWYSSRRPDRSATALVSVGNALSFSTTGLVVSTSAYPSLPAVAGVLGILTRGAPYSTTKDCSRLKLLKEPCDWIRRLAHLISPIPSDATFSSCLHITVDAIGSVLWFAAWTIVDYKLKVAPWANPLKTFLALEGALQAIVQLSQAEPNVSSGTSGPNFLALSSQSLACQPWSKHIQQGHLLMTFLGFLERIVANATGGFALALPRPVTPACTFFTANEATCSRWFTRVRSIIVRLAADMPLVTKAGDSVTVESSAAVVFHAARLLTPLTSHTPDVDMSKSFADISDEILVNVAQSLHSLSAWEDLQALAEWTDRFTESCSVSFNPYGWLMGVAALARGHWDEGTRHLRHFLDKWLTIKCTLSPTAYHTLLNGHTEAYLAHTAEVLLQCYLNEGNYQAACELQRKISPSSQSVSNDDLRHGPQLTSGVNWARLTCLSKLASWPTSEIPPVQADYPAESPFRWSSSAFTVKLDSLLVEAACSEKGSEKAYDNISKLVTCVRRACSSMYLPSCSVLSTGPITNLRDETGLCSWLIRADVLLDCPFQRVDDSDLADRPRNTVFESSWRHLIFDSSRNLNARINATLQACRWACANNSPLLLQRLLVRESEGLSLLKRTSDSTDLQALYNMVRTVAFCDTSHLSQIQRLRFSDCLAQLLWSTADLDRSTTGNNKLAALDVLSRGLRTALLEDVPEDMRQHAAQCRVSAEVALRLFEWLEEPVADTTDTWVDVVHNLTVDQTAATKLMKTTAIANNLNFFSRLVDEPWASGLPLIPSGDLAPGPNRSQASPVTSHTSWTSRLLMMATRLSPTGSSPLAWLRMADWCFTRGQAVVEDIRATTRALLGIMPESDASINPPKYSVLEMLQPGEREAVYDVLVNHAVLPGSCSHTGADGVSHVELHLPRIVAGLASFLILNGNPKCGTEANDELLSSLAHLDEHHNKHISHIRLSHLCPDERTDENGMAEKLISHLRTILPDMFPKFVHLPLELAKKLHQIVVALTQRQYSLHTSAAQAYATFLTVAGQHSSSAVLWEGPTSKLDTTTATLKLLDLLSAPSRALRNLIAGFLMHGGPAAQSFDFHQPHSTSHTPREFSGQSGEPHIPATNFTSQRSGTTLGGPSIWEACLPQVLVRLSLPDPSIRNCLVALLTRLILTGNQHTTCITAGCYDPSPSLRFAVHLVFPAVVAALDANFAEAAPKCFHEIKDSARSVMTSRPDSVSARSSPVSDSSAAAASESCFAKIIISLQNAGFSELVRQVEAFVAELQRITLLWEELWLGTLLQHAEELTKKVTLLQSEIKRTLQLVGHSDQHLKVRTSRPIQDCDYLDLPSSLSYTRSEQQKTNAASDLLEGQTERSVGLEYVRSTELQDTLSLRYLSVMQPTLSILSQLSALTLDVPPETPHEEWFQRTFAPMVSELREALVHPTDLTDAKAPLVLLRQLIYHLQTMHHTPGTAGVNPLAQPNDRLRALTTVRPSSGNVLCLSLHHVSPRLARMRFGRGTNIQDYDGIPLPGRYDLHAASLSSRVAVLPTKTRPKRLLFRSANGHLYPYLLKGLEDLRLDDRIMRLFELVNLALASDHLHSNQVCARTYAVTPLGIRSGLLQMVQGAVPLFSLYKRWQLRSAKMSHETSGSPMPTSVSVPRPGELFHTRLKELLTAAGLPYQAHARATWPVDTLKEVLRTLESETPPDLLSREIWASNPSCASWWHASRTFAHSAGLMSGLGYLVGLGDRHLDNLLVDLTTGHLIHIDYNVCFDKGRTLRVAERVPFRLTRILRHALGPLAQDTLVRGTFRLSAENTLSVVRKLLDPVLIQLKAFLIDPLVDWQHKRSYASQSSLSVSDFTHLSAYQGGGSSITRKHKLASRVRRELRIDAEIRLYAGLVTTRLLELCNSRSLGTATEALCKVTSHLRSWNQWNDAETRVANAERAHRFFTSTCIDELDQAEERCRAWQDSCQKLTGLRHDLADQFENWKQYTSMQIERFKQLQNPTWLTNLLQSSANKDSPLCIALFEYYSVARVYLTHSCIGPNHTSWTDCVSVMQSALDRFLQSPPTDDLTSLQTCLTTFHSTEAPSNNVTVIDPALFRDLDKAVHINHSLIEELQKSLADASNMDTPLTGELQSAISTEVENLHLFVYDQGSAGVMAYCWALIDNLPSMIANVLSLETDPQSWQQLDASTVSGFTLPNNHLDQLTMHVECLSSLFSVLHHQPTGSFHFSAGYEADVRREMSFLLSVRDACVCLSRLQTNLTRLLLPGACDALIDTSDDLAELFPAFVAKHVAESNSTQLPDLIDSYLQNPTVVASAVDARLYQVLIALHLTLTNTTAQIEEIARRIHDCSVTAPAWYYVDVVAQATATLLSRSVGWREGATNLWGWEPLSGCGPLAESSLPCSWVDEIYASGLMTFVSIIEECRAHWQAVQLGDPKMREDIILTPFANTINRFIGRLCSRVALASLVGLASGRLFCALIEDAELSVRRLVVENELNAKATGLPNPVIHITSDKLVECVSLHLTMTRAVVVQRLRGPAGNLIHRLVSRISRANDQLSITSRLQLSKNHHIHLTKTLTALHWIHWSVDKAHPDHPSVGTNEVALCVSSPRLPDVLTSIHQALINEVCLDEQLVAVAEAIYFFEQLRIRGPKACPDFVACQSLLTQLLGATTDEQAARAQLTEFDTIILDLKAKYNLQWPAHDWLLTACVTTEVGGSCTLMQQLATNVTDAKVAFRESLIRLIHTRAEMRSVYPIVESVTAAIDKAAAVPVAIVGRHAHKRAGRSGPQVPQQCSPDPTVESCANTSGKHSSLVSLLRNTLTTLQCERLAEIRQLIKILARYETARVQLACEDDQLSKLTSESSLPWTAWLESHQSWTIGVLRLFKQLSKFVTKLDSIAPLDAKRLQSDQMHSLKLEAEMADRLLTDCSSSQTQLWTNVIAPLIITVRHTTALDSHMSQRIHPLLANLEARLSDQSDGLFVFTTASDTQLDAIPSSLHTEHLQPTPKPDEPINSQALEIWCRIRDRLNGYDSLLCPDSPELTESKKRLTLTVQEQVDACIRAATDIENLALMYEGWTAWV
ncbi:hypothetical protein P879_02805 [Paragonimus westermani]|uniref:Non-specific serine/threonine protein kinase n=1 Tax=Paragonimus westermani TaxID=34504 RepID=A0A8T0DEF3_9TREM|nr:hypothetical protein P879_02805 [Paragonimus westermani]